MGIELKITADSVADLNNQMALLLNGAPIIVDVKTNAAEEPVIEAPKKSRKGRSAAQDTQESPTEETTTGPTATTAAFPSEDGEPVTYADVQKAVHALAAAKGRDAVVKILNDFGVDHATKLTEEQWAPAVEAFNAAKGE